MENKYKVLNLICFAMTIYQLSLFADLPTKILYSQTSNYEEKDNTDQQNITPIPFTPVDMATTNIDNQTKNKNIIGYFWDSKDTENSLLYPGKARIGNDQYINVIAIDSKKIDDGSNNDKPISIDAENIMDTHQQNNRLFKPGSLIKLGTFMKKNDPITYFVYGQYLSTVIPDPHTIEVL